VPSRIQYVGAFADDAEASMKRFITACVVIVSVLVGTAAQAHPELVQTTPAANATTASPAKVELRFSERLVSEFSGADLFMVDMPGMKMDQPSKEQSTAALGADGTTLTITPTKPLAAGTYRVDYHVVSTDTHKMAGTFSFRVK
jgi:methionine-rich copper-binding protein CopC